MSFSKVSIETPRTWLLPIIEQYVPRILENINDEITKYMEMRAPTKPEDILIEKAKHHIEIERDLITCVFEKNTYDFLGMVSCTDIQTEMPSLGLWIKLSEQGKGYGTEVIEAIMDWVRVNVGFSKFIYPVVQENIASQKIPIKLGGIINREYEKDLPTGRYTLIEYIIDRDKYLERLKNDTI